MFELIINHHLNIKNLVIPTLRNANNVWIYWKDLNGRYMGCNDLMVKTLGYTSIDNIINKKDKDFPICPNEMLAYQQSDHEVLESFTTKQFTDSATLKNNKIEFLVIKTPWVHQKEIKGIIGLSFYQLLEPKIKYQLTKREEQVLSLLVRGKTAKEIAIRLYVSQRTIEHHIENLKIKFKASNKSQLIEMALTFLYGV